MKLPDCWARSLLDFLRSLKKETLARKFSWPYRPPFVLDLSWFFKFLYNSLNTSSSVSSLFSHFPLRVASLMQNYVFMSVKFCDLWHFEWNEVIESWSYTNWQASQVKLIQHVYVMLKHVLHKPGVIELFHSSHFDMKSLKLLTLIPFRFKRARFLLLLKYKGHTKYLPL